jgi:hypothetical protein
VALLRIEVSAIILYLIFFHFILISRLWTLTNQWITSV